MRALSLGLVGLMLLAAAVQAAPDAGPAGAAKRHKRCKKVVGHGRKKHTIRVKCKKKKRRPVATATPKPTNTPAPSPTPTAAATPAPTDTPTTTPTATPTPAPTDTPTPTATDTPTPTPTATPTATNTPTATPTPAATGLDVSSPADATAGQAFAVTATTRDAGGAPIADVTSGTTFTITPDGTCTGASCQATIAGPHTVHGSYESLTGDHATTVSPGALHHLVVTPAMATVCPSAPATATADYSCPTSTSQLFAAEGRDAYDNSLGPVTAMSTFTGSGTATCAANNCSAGSDTTPNTITATDGSATGTAQLTGSDPLAMACRGANYDVDGTTGDGCEVADASLAGVDQPTAQSLGAKSCTDSDTGSVSDVLLSDTRAHANPTVSGFSDVLGARPKYYRISAAGGSVCVNDFSATITTSNGPAAPCYQFAVTTNKVTASNFVSGQGAVTLSGGSGSYSNNSTVYLSVTRTCTAARAATSFTINFHL